MKSFLKVLRLGLVLGVVLGFVFLNCFSVVTIVGDSMEPSLKTGDRVLELTEKLSSYELGDVVIARDTHTNRKIVKRVTAVEGDILLLTSAGLYRNGELLDRSNLYQSLYSETLGFVGTYKDTEYRIPKGYLFLMGDNREQSKDSRVFGLVPVESLDGEVIQEPAFLVNWLLGVFSQE